MSACNGLSEQYPRPKEIVDLSYWNTSEDLVREAHDIWATNYEQDMITSMYNSPNRLIPALQEALQGVFPSARQEEIKILDIGAGTGIIGQKLAAVGYTNLEGIDLSSKMLAIAEKKNIYGKIVCDSLFNWREHFSVGQFDAAVSCSVFTPGQLKPCALDEILFLVKPGGLMAHSIREDAYKTTEYGYGSKFEDLEKEGKLRLLKKERIVKYRHEMASEYTVPYSYIVIYQIIKHI